MTMPGNAQLFAKFPNDTFVETGTWYCGGIDAALAAGFTRIVSIELSPHHYAGAVAKFFDYPGVKVYHGDSAEILTVIAPLLTLPCTFWLDAHYSGLPDMAKGIEWSPILREITAINLSPVKTHTILVDDVRLFGQPDFDGTTMDQAKMLISRINPKYEFRLETGDNGIPNDILVATVQ